MANGVSMQSVQMKSDEGDNGDKTRRAVAGFKILTLLKLAGRRAAISLNE